MATVNAYPPGGTFFDTLKKSFVDVPVDKEKDNAVSTSEFLEAAESLTTLFGMNIMLLLDCWQIANEILLADVLGSVAFNVVKSDMAGNIKVRSSS